MVQIAHVWFVLEKDLPVMYGKRDGGPAPSKRRPPKTPVSGSGWRTALVSLGAFLGLCTVVGAAFRLVEHHKRRRREGLQRAMADGALMELRGSVGEASGRGSSGETGANGLSGKELLRQEHQAVADRMLEALTLGPLIGRGSFGQVYKGWDSLLFMATGVDFNDA